MPYDEKERQVLLDQIETLKSEVIAKTLIEGIAIYKHVIIINNPHLVISLV